MVGESTINSGRFERKYELDGYRREEVEAIVKLHPYAFREIYHQRYVNNFYFDSYDMKNYFENMFGIGNRTKVRIRWYGGMFGEKIAPTLEIKRKFGEVGEKDQFALESFALNSLSRLPDFQKVFADSKLPDRVRLMTTGIQAKLFNRYKRKYYLSADKKFRLTIDEDLSSHMIGASIAHEIRKSDLVVVELKYDFCFAEEGADVSSHLPFRVTKYSKYVSSANYHYS